MSLTDSYSNVFDALEPDPGVAKLLCIKADLMIAITEKIKQLKLNQTEAAKLLAISQPRFSDLKNEKIEKFNVDILLSYALRLGLTVAFSVQMPKAKTKTKTKPATKKVTKTPKATHAKKKAA